MSGDEDAVFRRLEGDGAKACWLELAQLLQRGGTVCIKSARVGNVDEFYALWEPPTPLPAMGARAEHVAWAVHRIYMKARRRGVVGTGPVS